MNQQQSNTIHITAASMADVSGRSVVELTGKDAQDLLHRLSTNDLSRLATGDVVQTVLTNEKGRIVDVLSVLKCSPETLLLVGQTQGGESLRQWLERYIIMEEARARNVTNDYTHLLLYHTDSPDQSRGISQNSFPLESLQQQGISVETFTERWGGTRLQHILCPLESHNALFQILLDQGFVSKEKSDFEFFRISNGIPSYPNELSTEYNPLEAGLEEFISFTKGCYIGQEVIARLDTYKKVQRKIFRLRLGALPLQLPERLYSNNTEVGLITSAASSNQNQNVRGLGYLKTSHGNETSLFFLNDNKEIPVTIDN